MSIQDDISDISFELSEAESIPKYIYEAFDRIITYLGKLEVENEAFIKKVDALKITIKELQN